MKNSMTRGLMGTLAAAVLLGAGFTPAHATNAVPEPTNNGPKNVIYMIGDGMGYNHMVNTNVYESGQSKYQLTTDDAGKVSQATGKNVQRFESFDMVSLESTSANGTGYDPAKAWANFDWAKTGATDSAAAGTAMATGTKTNNGVLGLDPATGEHLINISEIAAETGRSAGVVSSVQYSHATPAAFAVSNTSRNNYQAIGHDMIEADYLDVVLGAGHPEYTDNGTKRESPKYSYISASDYTKLADAQTEWEFIDEKAEFEAVANGQNVPEKLFGLAQAETTLQQNRKNSGTNVVGRDAFNDNVPTLETMTSAALNVLGQNDNGFSVMIEGGAIDWTGHANQTVRNIEETQDFFASVDAAIDWVEENSSWDETLLIVTADHETGYLSGKDGYSPITGERGVTPTVGWFSGNHTTHLVPFFAKGEGAAEILAEADMVDPVRGNYLDNTDPANVIFELWQQDQVPAEGDIPVEATVPELGSGTPGDGENGGDDGDTNQGSGSLVLSVTPGTAELGKARNAGDRLRMTGDLPAVKVTDTRVKGNGWTVSGQSSQLTTGKATVRANALGWIPHVVSSTKGAKPGSSVATTLSGGEGLAAPQTLGSADIKNRLGTTSLSADLVLEVPVDTKAGTYEGAMSVSLFPVD